MGKGRETQWSCLVNKSPGTFLLLFSSGCAALPAPYNPMEGGDTAPYLAVCSRDSSDTCPPMAAKHPLIREGEEGPRYTQRMGKTAQEVERILGSRPECVPLSSFVTLSQTLPLPRSRSLSLH